MKAFVVGRDEREREKKAIKYHIPSVEGQLGK